MNIQGLLIGSFSLASGLVMFVLPRRSRLAAEADNSVRKAELRAGATERYFEERRTLDAYPPAPTDGKWRLKGAFFTLLGLALIVLSSFR